MVSKIQQNHLGCLLLQIKLRMAILAVIELDCIKMDWKKNDNLLLVKIISICNKEIFGVEKSSKFNQRTAENFEDQIFEIKNVPTLQMTNCFFAYQKLKV